jgi:hypothetical protein
MRKADAPFLENIKRGDRIFKYKEGDKYTLYTVLEKPASQEVILTNIFDKKEKLKKLSFSELIADGSWWYNPLFEN